ncbi:ATP-binding protein [Streptomyces sp. NBC_01237]|uniref:ATP-binding protein n=1 Tax=Streptomyces sp. NBC_01237 TaxID=2903790 RepID=UPI002DD8B838|nr:ATP-binding protein [Streptomyces sp. NBC_01237]WRZ75389.1 ATP-binding protein [Streptomyces sp. NBC_01237]
MNIPTKRLNAVNGSVNTSPPALNTEGGTVNDRPDHVNTIPAAVNKRQSTGGPTDRPGGGDGDGGKKQSAAVRLVALARERYTFVTSTDGRPYAVAIDGPNLALPLRGRTGLRQRLARLYADTFEGDVASQSALADAMTVLEGIADSEDPVPVHLRVGNDDSGRIVVDLGTADGRAVTVSGADGWHVVERSPVLFRRSGAMAPMPTPVLDGDGLAKLHGLLNMDETTFRQLVAWLVAAWIPTIPHPVLTFKGEQGTGKSKTAQMVVNLIDPSPASKRSQPRDIKAWSAQAFNSWALCLDNVSTIPPWLSDTLCKAVTGDGIVDRALYTDDDVVVLSFRRVLAMTTIDAGALAGDLAERLLMLDLQLIEEDRRRTEEELDGRFEEVRPAVLGALFDLLACVLATLPTVRLDSMPRMADFARVLAAVDQVQEWQTLDTYLTASANVAGDALEGDLFGSAVAALVEEAGTWTGTAAQLLEQLQPPGGVRPPNWPKDATRAGGKVKRLAPLLRSVGITVDDTQRSRDRHRHKLLILTRTDPPDESASAASAPQEQTLWPDVAPIGQGHIPPDLH